MERNAKYKAANPKKVKRPSHRELTVPEKHQLRIAYDTLRMPDAMVGVMGGRSKPEAREIIKRLTGKTPKENPSRAKYCHERVVSPNKFSPDSFRIVRRDGHRIIIGCPIGHYDHKTGRCRVGTRVQAILHPQAEKKCPIKKNPGAAWHEQQAKLWDRERHGPKGKYREFDKGAAFAHRVSQHRSEQIGINPIDPAHFQRIVEGAKITLDGKPAIVSGYYLSHPVVASLHPSGPRIPFSKEAIVRVILHNKGRFSSNPKKNPGEAWHLSRAQSAEEYQRKATDPIDKAGWKAYKEAHQFSAKQSKQYGMNPRGMTKIYDKTIRIEAQKGKGSLFAGEKFYHDFKGKSEASIYGLPDGSLLIKSNQGKRLWDNIKQK